MEPATLYTDKCFIRIYYNKESIYGIDNYLNLFF